MLVRDYRKNTDSWIRGVILKQFSPVTYQVQCGQYVWKRHMDQILDLSGVPRSASEQVQVGETSQRSEVDIQPEPYVNDGATSTNSTTPPVVLSSDPQVAPNQDNIVLEPVQDNNNDANTNTSMNMPSPVPRRVQPLRQRRRPERLIESK